ncbi:MAG: hypothetical protein V2A74_04150, partial [bacterium]
MPLRKFSIIRNHLYWLLPCFLYLKGVSLAPHTGGEDLLPRPDALEYALLADRLASFEPPLIPIGLRQYPSRYPLAYPLLLVPFSVIFPGDTTKFYLGATLFGLAATFLLAYSGAWMLGSRAAGGMAAAFWALHPQTLSLAKLNMSEMGVVMMFAGMICAARPWLEKGMEAKASARRAAMVGIITGWLVVAKFPFVWWAFALSLVVAWSCIKSRNPWPAVAMVAAIVLMLAGDALYRRWAFGAWGMNGYEYWAPEVYGGFGVTFSSKYLVEPWTSGWSDGNLIYYWQIIIGATEDYYSEFMAWVALGSAACLFWPRWKGRPGRLIVWLMFGWGIVGLLFCSLYFFQSERFVILWIPIIDLLVAWGLMKVWSWDWLRRGWRGRFQVHLVVRFATALVALALARGEYLWAEETYRFSPDQGQRARAYDFRELLEKVPEGEWVFSNYEMPLVEEYRSHKGPVGAIYVHYPVDFYCNAYIPALYYHNFPSSRA